MDAKLRAFLVSKLGSAAVAKIEAGDEATPEDDQVLRKSAGDNSRWLVKAYECEFLLAEIKAAVERLAKHNKQRDEYEDHLLSCARGTAAFNNGVQYNGSGIDLSKLASELALAMKKGHST
jgi:hypothetical protein